MNSSARRTGSLRLLIQSTFIPPSKIIIFVKSKLRATLFQDILDEADKDQNGLIDYKEFFDMMEPGRS